MTYVIADIHGEYDLFVQLLNKIRFSLEDNIIICGDIIDKGQDSVKLLKLIKSMPNARCVIGNHEYVFLSRYHHLMEQSPDDFDGVLNNLKDYFEDGYLLDYDVLDWLESLPYYIEEEDFICVHAGVPLNADKTLMALENAKIEQLVYDRQFKERNVYFEGDKCVFFGHTPISYINNQNKITAYKKRGMNTGTIKDFYKVHLDTGVWILGVMGCFCVDNCTCYYVEK